MRFVSLFAGIGGIDLGLERAGMECVAQVENDPYCVRVLEKHWPDVPRWEDIRDLDPEELPDHDLIAGGFPCQPVSLAGARLGTADERWLWPEYFRVVRVVRPRYVLVENVPGLLTAGFGEVAADLASVGYDTEWTSIPAAAVGAPHLRWRVFLVAYPDGGGLKGVGFAKHAELEGPSGRVFDGRGARGWRQGPHMAYPDQSGSRSGRSESEGRRVFGSSGARGGYPHWAIEPSVGKLANGVPDHMARLRGLGNAVVPQVAELVGHMILEAHNER